MLWSLTTVAYHPHFTEPRAKDALPPHARRTPAAHRPGVRASERLPGRGHGGFPSVAGAALGAETENYTQQLATELLAHLKSENFLVFFHFPI